ncbi:MAG TPA: energy transducer TonB [Candidatus Acidoferrales bacterium]|nr:energy transducer TonB [Candidatus Acidoferrales bacterium]
MILSSLALSAALLAGMGAQGAPADAPLRVSGVVMQNKIVKQEAPKYPEAARKKGVQGTVTLDIVVGADGSVKSVKVADGDKDLGKAAASAVKHWRYQPTISNSKAIPVETTVSVDFHLTAPPKPQPKSPSSPS